MNKVKYHFRFRAISDPPDLEELEAGPFTEEEAATYARRWQARREFNTGRVWVGEWYEAKLPALSQGIVVAAFLVAVITIAAALLHFLVPTQ